MQKTFKEKPMKSILGGLLVTSLVAGCAGSNPSPDELIALPAPAVASFPAPAAQVQAWADTRDTAKIRAHAWDVWASITTTLEGSSTPIWETWYSGYELFEMDPSEGRRLFPDFENPSQFFHSGQAPIPTDGPERVTAFNRYSPSLAEAIWTRGLNRSATLEVINTTFDDLETPVIDRELITSQALVDASQIVLKPVFQIVDSSAPVAIPYWDGFTSDATTNQKNPEPHTWKQCIAIDPSGTLTPGETIEMECNGVLSLLEVVPPESFYSIRLTKAQADDFSTFALGSTDDIGVNNDTSTQALAEVVKEGNLALLVAMHVTTKEIVNWTWQTFWWSPNPLDATHGADRPDWVEGPWRNYNMLTAYYMVEEFGNPDSAPLIAFNPYLETNLEGTFEPEDEAEVAWTGVTSNCMTCHRLAAWKKNEARDPTCFSFEKNSCGPKYRDNGFIDPASEYIFGGYTKVDFLWSLQMRPE